MANNGSNIQSGERLSFFKLFNEKGYLVEIPIIQRDFAQGRNTSIEVRETFLDALNGYLDENLPNRDLDFVYGSLVTDDETKFIPLDGQQRLTTLFLLHWYLANLSGNLKKLREAIALKGKSKFTYETRTSSREFCDALLSNEIDLNKLLQPDKGKNNDLSRTIQDCGWYYLSWENDPTIQSMLIMLDSIHIRFSKKPEYFYRLVDEKKPVITFLFLNLNEFKLTDDLYIKMNARGKPLTTFETFKAKLEQHIGHLNWNSDNFYKLIFGNKEKVATIKEYFAHKIDTEWANLFWNYRNVSSHDDSFDQELMNFIRVILTNQRCLDVINDKDITLEYLIGTYIARIKPNYTDNISFYRYKIFEALTKQSITYLINALDKLTNGENKIKSYLADPFYFNEQKIFEKVLKHELTLPERVRFHAYTKFLIEYNKNEEGFSDWMRVIYNLTENTVIDGSDEVAKAIKSIEKLLQYSSNILNFLKDNKSTVDFFNGRQVQEERIKASLITKRKIWKDEIEAAEKHGYFLGQIGFLFEFSGILAFFEQHGNCNWPDAQDINFFNAFLNYKKKAMVAFNAWGTGINKDFLWERTVLTKGDYLIPASSYRYNFLSTNKNLRDYSWKRLLRLIPIGANDQENNEWHERRSFVKEVFDDPKFNADKLAESMVEICKITPDDWRKYFIINPDLIRYCEQGFIRFESDSKIILFKESQLNHRHREMYSYNLHLTRLIQTELFLPFKISRHYEVRSGEDFSRAEISDWCYARKYYSIDIYCDINAPSINMFEVLFYKSKGDRRESEFPHEITTALKGLNFKWKDEYVGFLITRKNEESTIVILRSLCAQLQSLKTE